MPASIEQLSAALVKADAAGNTADAKVFADALRALKAQSKAQGGDAPAAVSDQPPAGAVPGSREYADWAAAAARSGRRDLPQISPAMPPSGPPPLPAQQPNLLNSTLATVNGLVDAVPGLQEATDAIGGGISQMTGGDFGKYVQHQKDVRDQLARSAPLARVSGDLAGAATGYGALAKIPGMAVALGLEGGFVPRVVNSGLSQLGIGTADSMLRGEKPTDALGENVAPAAIASAIPILGAGGKYAGKLLNDNIVKPISTAFNRENEVTTRLGTAIQQDKNVGAAMLPTDEAVAAGANVPVMNADRFGPSVRGLARTAANISPEAKGRFVRTIEDRFTHQSGRAIDFVKGLMNGSVDDLALHDQVRAAADRSNSMAYAQAFSDENAQQVFSPQLQELLQSDSVQNAIKGVMTRGSDRAAVDGVVKIKDAPFRLSPRDGKYRLIQKADGTLVAPNLAFWDQIKRNLDSMVDTAKTSGDRTRAADLMGLKSKLVNSLDAQVPAYKAARSGAAGFFGAEDAIDAGRKALGTKYQIPEIERAYGKLKPAERTAAAVGYASELIDRFKGSGDHRNFIGQFFDSPEARRKNELFLGPDRARQLEAYVRVEGIVDQLRGAVTGNSTTAQQLIAAGVLGGAGGYFGSGGDIQTGFTAATLATLGRRGLQVLGKRVDDQVMSRVAEILVSKNPKDLERAIQNAALSKAHMDALAAIYRGMTLAGRSAVAVGAPAMAAAQ